MLHNRGFLGISWFFNQLASKTRCTLIFEIKWTKEPHLLLRRSNAMAVIRNNATGSKMVSGNPNTDHILFLLITNFTWLFVVVCIVLFFYYHWQVCRFITASRHGPLCNSFPTNYHPGKRARKDGR